MLCFVKPRYPTMINHPNLIVMLTTDDYTSADAYNIFECCKYSNAEYWGMKEAPLPVSDMKKLYSYMKKYNKKTILEVVSYNEKECIDGAKIAVECNCDILMGTYFFDSVNEICIEKNIRYMPFVGEVTERPSVLNGDIDEMIEQAYALQKKGVYGFDLLGYRYTGNQQTLINKFICAVNAPICIAGSIDNFEKLDFIRSSSPWAFTVGSAFFKNKFDGTFCEQINKVCEYIQNNDVYKPGWKNAEKILSV